MYILKDTSCTRCGGIITIIGSQETGDERPVVSHGVCTTCLKNVVLPQDEFFSFVQENCYQVFEFERFYAGVGSRVTPEPVQALFRSVAAYLAKEGYGLRSGAAKGSDAAFEAGCDDANGVKEIYLPWANFEGSDSKYIVKDKRAFEIAEQYHPKWERLNDGEKKLQARNSHQIFGWTLDVPSYFVICWTKNGSGEGGTGQAIRIAKANNLPIFDAGKHSDIKECRKALHQFLKEVMK